MEKTCENFLFMVHQDILTQSVENNLTIHYEIAPIETRRPIKVGYHDDLRALQSVPLVAVSFVSQHESSREFGYLLHKKKEFT